VWGIERQLEGMKETEEVLTDWDLARDGLMFECIYSIGVESTKISG